MPTNVITCADVESRDLEAGYLAGRLAPDEAAAYEAHYFGCDRCWPSLRRATELRAALATAQPAARFRVTPALAAAAVLVVALGGWLSWARLMDRGEAGTTRGSADSLVVEAVRGADVIAAMWHPVAGADRYRVRLYTPDGTLVTEQETTDTTFALTGDAEPGDAGRLFWQVQALDVLRQELARSALTPTGRSPTP